MQVPPIFPRATRRVSIFFVISLLGLCSSILVSALAQTDVTPPTVQIDQAEEQPDPTNSSPIIFTVVFSEPVVDFTTGDVTVDGTAGATTATVTDSGDGMTFNVFVSGMTTNGTVIVSISEGVATDAAGNPNAASTSIDNTVTFNGFETSNSFVVTKTADTNDGACNADCSLREALTAANAQPGFDTVAFNIPASDSGRNAATGVSTINVSALLGALPQITDQVFIDGYTQGTISTPGDASDDARQNTNPLSAGLNTRLLIELTDDAAGIVNANGLHVAAGGFNSRIRGLAIYGFSSGAGVNITGAGGVRIEGNFLGVRADGTTSVSNNYGVRVTGAPRTMIGGTTVANSNLISGNGEAGVLITEVNASAEDANIVQNNLIGTNALGVLGLPSAESAAGVNKGGVLIIDASGVLVGGAGLGNVISGNNGIGVIISGSASAELPTANNIVQGNLIGVTANGTTALGNNGDGVEITNAQSNLIGGTHPGEGNTISFNNSANGVAITGALIVGSESNDNTIVGNTITSNGMDGILITSGTGNRINGNSIFSNAQQGIDLLGDGVTANDPDDADPVAGPNANNLQNFPVISSAVRNTVTGLTIINGTLDGGTRDTAYLIELFANAACDGTNGEGQTIIGSVITGAADANGDVTFTFQTSANISGQVLTATATDDLANDTSEFSACAPVTAFTPPPVTPDLQSGSDTGASSTDNLTSDVSPTFDISGVAAGTTVELLRDGVVVAVGTASGATISLTDPGPVPDGTHNYTGRQTGESATSAQSGALQVTFDTSAPSVNINQSAGQSDPTNTSPVSFTVIFSEPVTGFQTGDVTLSGTAGATSAIVTPVGSDGTTYNVEVSGMTQPGTITASIASGVAEDAAGNQNAASTSTDNTVTYNPPGQLQFKFSTFMVSESGGAATVVVTRTGGSGGAISATFNTSDGTANAGADYTAVNNFTISFADGDSSEKTVSIPVTDDTLEEPDETVNLTLSSPTGGATLGTQSTATLIVTGGDVPTVQFAPTAYSVTEDCSFVTLFVTRTGDSSAALTVNYASSPVTASERSDYTTAIGTLHFAAGQAATSFDLLISEDSLAEGTETFNITLSDPTIGTQLGAADTATVEITDDGDTGAGANAIDDPATFVCQQYHDFLGRQADTEGQSFWTAQITSCGTDEQCVRDRRINVSAAFFLSVEFQETGYLVIRMHKTAFGDEAGNPRFRSFLADMQQVRRDVVVGGGNWEAQLEANQQAYAEAFVSRSDFTARYPQGQSAGQFVDALFESADVTPSAAERQAAIDAYGSGDTAGRARALRGVVESDAVYNAFYNPAFVLLEYFGYLRRNPDDAPDNNFEGYNFWLSKLDSFSQPGEDVRNEEVALRRVHRAQMVESFITSGEYRQRFGQ